MALQAQNWQAAGNAADSALDFEDVRELIGRFNAALQDCDYSTARCIIAALFNLDRVDSDDFRAKEVQNADLVCQCLDSFSTRIFHVYQQRKDAAMLAKRRPPTHFDANWAEQPNSEFDLQAIEHLSGVNALVKRHMASQRFRRVWLSHSARRKRQNDSNSCSVNTDMRRFEMTIQRSFRIETMLLQTLAWQNISKTNPSECVRYIQMARDAFRPLEGCIDDSTEWGRAIKHTSERMTAIETLINKVLKNAPHNATNVTAVGVAASEARSEGRSSDVPCNQNELEARNRAADEAACNLMKELELEEQAASAKKDKKKKKKAKARDSAPVLAAEHQDASANAEDSGAVLAPAVAISKELPDKDSKKHLMPKAEDPRQREETPAATAERSQALHARQSSHIGAAANAEEPPPEHGETQAHGSMCMPPMMRGGSGAGGGEAECGHSAAARGECARGEVDSDNASGSRAHRDVDPRHLNAALQLSEVEEARDSEPLQNARQGEQGSAAAMGKGARGEGARGEAARGEAAGAYEEEAAGRLLAREQAAREVAALQAAVARLCGRAEALAELSDEELEALKAEQEAALQRVTAEVLTRKCAAEVAARHEAFVCPISLALMRDPVVAADGHTYERIEIERWFRRARDSGEEIRSPQTNEVLPYSMLAPNHSMRFLITSAIEDEVRNSNAQLQLPQAHRIPTRTHAHS